MGSGNKKEFTIFKICVALYIIAILINPTIITKSEKIEYDKLVDRYSNVDFVRDAISNLHINDVSDEELEKNIIEYMLGELGDKRTIYYDKQEFEKFKKGMKGKNRGIGIAVNKDENTGEMTIIYINPNGSAVNSGFKLGDKIIKIEGTNVKGIEDNPFDKLFPTETGEYVEIEVLRDNRKVKLSSEIVEYAYETIKVDKFEDTGYIYIHQFSLGVGKEFNRELDKLLSEGIKSLVVDLRNNPGGNVKECLIILNKLQGEGVAFKAQLKNGEGVFETKGKGLQIPIKVLVNENSASSSEILAYSIKDNNKGTIIGKRTYGKGTAQLIIGNGYRGSGIALTIQENLSPKGHTINKKGVVPDIEVDMLEDGQIYSIGENLDKDKQLKKALEK